MTIQPKRNLQASVRQRLLNLSRQRGEVFDLVLNLYALERLLYRLGISELRDRFVLKGALLFALWSPVSHRPTRDLDLLGYGSPNIDEIENEFRSLCGIDGGDGITFIPDSVHGEQIREGAEYQGVRITLNAEIDHAHIKLQIDIGFGDAVTPAPELISFPTLLDFPAPRLRAYPIYTVIAEKFEAVVKLGMANTRMKDFYDLWFLAQRFEFNGDLLRRAIKATFDRRGTSLPSVLPLALSDTSAADPGITTQWAAFVHRSKLLAVPVGWADVITVLRQFLMPPAIATGKDEPFIKRWVLPGKWNAQVNADVSKSDQ